jgi:hypothetical protein
MCTSLALAIYTPRNEQFAGMADVSTLKGRNSKEMRAKAEEEPIEDPTPDLLERAKSCWCAAAEFS